MKSPTDQLLDQVEWKPVIEPTKSDDNGNPEPVNDLPFVTHEGILKLGEIELKVVQLSDGRRVFPAAELEKLLLIPV